MLFRSRSKHSSRNRDLSDVDRSAPKAVNTTFGVLVSAVTFYDSKVLLLRRSLGEKFLPGAWGLPAGKIQYGEKPDQAALRELYEEAGIRGRVRQNVGTIWFESEYQDREVQHIQFNFEIQADSSSVKLIDGSNMDYRWIALSELDEPPVPIDEFTRQVISQAVESANIK